MNRAQYGYAVHLSTAVLTHNTSSFSGQISVIRRRKVCTATVTV